MNRRNFIKGIAGFAALAASGTPLAYNTPTERERFLSLVNNSRVMQGQTFLISDAEPLVISGVRDLLILNCAFIWQVPAKMPLLYVREDCEGLEIVNSFFDGKQKFTYCNIVQKE